MYFPDVHAESPLSGAIVLHTVAHRYREVIGFSVAQGESEVSRNTFFEQMKARGLKNVEHVTSMNHSGLGKAIRKGFGRAKRTDQSR